jgi:hypothetical protein
VSVFLDLLCRSRAAERCGTDGWLVQLL